ncbi:hypothetical protein Q4521_20845, partial [Saccharophagus degradans]|nr:hypothetical protein [Saccharophagus degradans]
MREENRQDFRTGLSRSFLFGFVSLVSQSQINKIWRLSKYTQNFEKGQKPVLILAGVAFCCFFNELY